MRTRHCLPVLLLMVPAGITASPRPQEVPPVARPLPFSDVRLTGGPLKHAQDLDAAYLLGLEPDRMLAYLREHAGLEPKAEGYGGWDGPGRQITGHIAGHYLSGVSLMYAATGDERFKERADYLVSQLAEIQAAHGDGYIGAQRDREGTPGKAVYERLAQGEIRSSNFDLNGLWSPWYVQHKLFAGLRDAWRHTGNRTALDVESRFAAWVERILAGLNHAQTQRMLATEFGGMNQVMADLYADTGQQRWLTLAARFHHKAVVDPLAEGQDILEGLHGNTQVPKLLGTFARYTHTGQESLRDAAVFFWEQVALHHSFATGGHGRNEYYGEPDRLADMTGGRTAETCNVYNMVKLSRALFARDPRARYADFHERALFNHILGSIDPEEGSVCYMVPVGNGVQREYQNMTRSFTCCVGSGMESHALHGYGIYYESGDRFWVNLYVPSRARWTGAGVDLEMVTDFPEGETATLRIRSTAPRRFTLALRQPWWAADGFEVRVNGRRQESAPSNDGYVEIDRTWRDGDEVSVTLPKSLHLEALPDDPDRAALMWGPLVLAADLGPEVRRGRGRAEGEGGAEPSAAAPLVVPGGAVSGWLGPDPEIPGRFVTRGLGLEEDLVFEPFYRLHRRRYAVYLDVYTPERWALRRERLAAEEREQQRLEEATVVFVEPASEDAAEVYAVRGEGTETARSQGRSGLRAEEWFSVSLPAGGQGPPSALVVTLNTDENRTRGLRVVVGGRTIGVQRIQRKSPQELERFFDVTFALPADLVEGRERIEVRLEASGEGGTPAVYAIRLVRGPA